MLRLLPELQAGDVVNECRAICLRLSSVARQGAWGGGRGMFDLTWVRDTTPLKTSYCSFLLSERGILRVRSWAL